MIIYFDKNPIGDILCNIILLALNTMIFLEFLKVNSKQKRKEQRDIF